MYAKDHNQDVDLFSLDSHESRLVTSTMALLSLSRDDVGGLGGWWRDHSVRE
jgi:hypothetical protein